MLIKFSVQSFLDEREFQNVSQETLKGYNIFLREFQTWLRENDIIHIEDVSTNTIKTYLVYCKKERNNAPSTINNKLKNLKAFFNFLIEEEVIDKNPCFKIQKQKVDSKIEVFTDSEIKMMLRYYRRLKRKDHEFTAYRNTAIIITLIGTGIRIGELRNLRWTDVTINSITVYGKNRRQETVPLTEKVYDELMDLKSYYDSYFDSDIEYVFSTRSGEQMGYEATKSIFKRLQDTLGLKKRLSAHIFRHTYAQRCILNGMDAFTLQRILRHKNISMTMRYVNLWSTDLEDQNEKFNPLNNMDI